MLLNVVHYNNSEVVARCPTDRTLSIGGDARVVAPMALSWLEKAQASYRAHRRPDPNHATKLVEADKHAKYDQLCQLLNPPLTCLPAVLTDCGGIGRELYSAIIQPHFQQLYEAEVAEGKSGWAARRAKQRWLQHTSVTDSRSPTATSASWPRCTTSGEPPPQPPALALVRTSLLGWY